MTSLITIPVGGTLGIDKGGAPTAAEGLAGFLAGSLAQTAVGKAYLKSLSQPVSCFTFDATAIAYVAETTDANDVGTSDVALLNGTTLAVNDALYIGHASKTFAQVDMIIGQEGDHAAAVWAWEYWNGTAWTALTVTSGNSSTIFDGSGTGLETLTYTLPTDWEVNTVHSSTEAYWIRARVTTGAAVVAQCLISQIWAVVSASNAVFTDYTTEINQSTTNDVPVTGAGNLKVGDQFIIGHTSQKFPKVKINLSTAMVSTITIVWKYWDGDSWAAIAAPIFDQTEAGGTAFEATAADGLILGFEPPSDWTITTTANGPGGTAGYFIAAEITAVTSLTTQGFIKQAFVYPLITGALGVRAPSGGTITRIDMHATVPSGTTADSRFLLINATQGTFDEFTWTKAVGIDQVSVNLGVTADDQLVLAQVTEDGTTEFAGAAFHLTLTA